MSDLGPSAKEQATKMGKTVRTLARWRELGKGPPFVKICGRVHYPADKYAAWLGRRLVDTEERVSA